MNYHVVSWEELQNTLYTLAETIHNSKQKFDIIVAIARGGLTISHVLSDFLELPVASFTVQSYKNYVEQGELKITYELGGDLRGKSVLLVDDVADSGQTFLRAIEHLKLNGATTIVTAAPYYKPKSIYKPDFFVTKTRDWIIFPFDMRESVRAISAELREKEWTPGAIRQELQRMGIPKLYTTRFAGTLSEL